MKKPKRASQMMTGAPENRIESASVGFVLTPRLLGHQSRYLNRRSSASAIGILLRQISQSREIIPGDRLFLLTLLATLLTQQLLKARQRFEIC